MFSISNLLCESLFSLYIFSFVTFKAFVMSFLHIKDNKKIQALVQLLFTSLENYCPQEPPLVL